MSRFRLSTTVVLLGVTSFFADVGSEMVFPLLPVFVADTLGGGGIFVGIIEGVADAVASVLKFFTGRVVDRLPRRKPLVLAGYALATAARPLLAIALLPGTRLRCACLIEQGRAFGLRLEIP